jgi:hypothetical protein
MPLNDAPIAMSSGVQRSETRIHTLSFDAHVDDDDVCEAAYRHVQGRNASRDKMHLGSRWCQVSCSFDDANKTGATESHCSMIKTSR